MEQLINYIENYFNQYEDAQEIKNTLISNLTDYYNELIAQGLSHEQATQKAQESLGDLDELTKDLPIKSQQITSINLKLSQADVYIYPSDLFDFEIKTDNPFTIQENMGSINIIQPNNSNAKVKLYITKDTSSLNITNHDGDTQIKNITCNSVNLVINNGDIELSNTTINSLNIINHDGDIELVNNTIASASIECFNGDIEIEQNTNFDSYNIINHDGDIEINCDIEPINLDCQNHNGDIDIGIISQDIDYNKLKVINYNGDIEID